MEVGTIVRFKATDHVYPTVKARVVKVDEYIGEPYIGLELMGKTKWSAETKEYVPEVTHLVWRREEQLVVEGREWSITLYDLHTGKMYGGGKFTGRAYEDAEQKAYAFGAVTFPGRELHAALDKEGE